MIYVDDDGHPSFSPSSKKRGKRKKRKRRKVRTLIQRRAALKMRQLLWLTRSQTGAKARIDNPHHGIICVSQCQWPSCHSEVSQTLLVPPTNSLF